MNLQEKSKSLSNTVCWYSIFGLIFAYKGIFDEDEYFDVVVEYGKDPANEKNLVCCYTITNHSSQSADITVLPQFWLPNDVSQK